MPDVTKSVRFAAPYRSKTFNDKDALLVGRNGVMRGCVVTESGGITSVGPGTIIQNGLMTDIPMTLSVTTPPNLSAPYFIAISISSPIQVPGEVITPIFVKRPQDINPQVTLVAEFDGGEWRPLPRLQIQERIRELEEQTVRSGLVGVSSGFNVVRSGSNLIASPGTLIAADGTDVAKDSSATLAIPTTPATGTATYDRIDSLVFRKPLDSPHRIGQAKLITGPTFTAATGTHTETAATFGAAAPTQIKVKEMSSSPRSIIAYREGTTLKMISILDDFTASSVMTVASNVDEFDFTEDFDGYLDFVYKRNTDLYHKRVSFTNTVIVNEAQLYTSIKVLHTPTIACVGIPTNYQIHIAVCREMTGTAREIGYVRLASDASVITPYVQWVNLTSQLSGPTFAKDDADSVLHLGFWDADTDQAYLRTYDASTATASAPPVQMGNPVQLQDDTYDVTASVTLPTTGASDLRIVRTDNKELFVFWKHFRASGQYSVAIYNPRYKALFGHKALVLDNEDIDTYDVKVDGMNRAYCTTVGVGATDVIKNVFNLETLERIGTSDTLVSGAASECGVGFTYRGDLLNVYAAASNGAHFRSTAAVKTTLREQFICPTDVYMAYYRKSDDLVSVSDNLVGEEPAIRRLYEFTNMFGASGVVSWNVAGANKLVTSAISIRFLNRSAALTIAAIGGGGVTIADGSAIYVEIPDEDVAATLTTQVTPFGQGKLDRSGKRALPLFWNIGGRLYSNFAPYSFSQDGETVVIGGTISEELIAWLGSVNSAPDASNHGYGSTQYILESDSIVTAIGKLDAAQAGVVAAGTASVVPLNAGNTSVTVTFGSPRATAFYRLVTTLENISDAEPMFQSMMVTAKDANGFTVSWPSPLDTGNYLMDFILRDTV